VANKGILIGPARQLVDETLGADNYDIIYVKDYNITLVNVYRYIILTGQESLDRFHPGLGLSTARGFVYHLGNCKLVATFWPQDCVDLADYESLDSADESEDVGGSAKDDAPTQRPNYRFWFQRDCAKLRSPPSRKVDFAYNLCGNGEAARILAGAEGRRLYLDIETHPPTNTLQCLSFAIADGPVYTCCVYDYNGRLTEGAVELIASLARAIARNKVIIHNAGFDLLFLALYHGIPFGRDIEDTMIMGHRIWPEAEKSLAHNISLYLNEPYHKSEGGTWTPRNWAQQDRLLRYNAKDVATLRAVHEAQWRFVDDANDPGLRASVVQGNSSIYPYLYTSFHGLPVNGMKLLHYKRAREALAGQLERVTQVLSGYNLNPNSPPQLADYFVKRMKCPVLARTPSGDPSVDETTLYKYLAKFRNPLIRVILKFKRARKVAGELGFRYFVPIKKR
jgi:hypothetical protein